MTCWSAMLSVVLACAPAFAVAEGPTVLVWTGDGDGVTFDSAANWSGTPDSGSIDLTNLTEWFVVDDVTAQIGGRSGTSTLNFTGAGGLNMRAGRLMRGAANQAIEAGYVLVQGGIIDRQWISNSSVRLEDTGHVVFSGSADPVPNGTTIDLGSKQCTVEFLGETPSAFQSEHISKFRVNGASAIVNLNIEVVAANEGIGCIVSVLPDLCPGDISGDLVVDGNDLAVLLGSWGTNGEDGSDLTGDNLVDGQDLTVLLGSWGECDTGPDLPDCGSPKHCEVLYPDP